MFNKDDITAFDYHNKAVVFLHDARVAKAKFGIADAKVYWRKALEYERLALTYAVEGTMVYKAISKSIETITALIEGDN